MRGGMQRGGRPVSPGPAAPADHQLARLTVQSHALPTRACAAEGARVWEQGDLRGGRGARSPPRAVGARPLSLPRAPQLAAGSCAVLPPSIPSPHLSPPPPPPALGLPAPHGRPDREERKEVGMSVAVLPLAIARPPPRSGREGGWGVGWGGGSARRALPSTDTPRRHHWRPPIAPLPPTTARSKLHPKHRHRQKGTHRGRRHAWGKKDEKRRGPILVAARHSRRVRAPRLGKGGAFFSRDTGRKALGEGLLASVFTSEPAARLDGARCV